MIVALLAAIAPCRGTAGTKAAENENPHVWKPKTVSVAVFKNGMGFFMREGDVALRDGWSTRSS